MQFLYTVQSETYRVLSYDIDVKYSVTAVNA